MNMKKMYITIKDVHDIAIFVNHASKVDGDVTCKRGKYVIDGKSIMGIFSIDTSEGMIVEYPENSIEFEQYISQFKKHGVEV